MRPVLTPGQASALDAAASDPLELLMERAGMAVALVSARAGASYGRRVLVLAGPGNNGGDGYVAARHLSRRGGSVEVRAFGDPTTEAARWARAAAELAGVRIRPLAEPEPADLVVDALFGGGFRGELPEPIVSWTATDARVIAVDVPSGLDGGTGRTTGPSFTADATVTFGALKVGHLLADGPDRCGRLEVADIGLPEVQSDLWLCEETDAPRPGRSRHAHKWSSGSVMVVGGSPGIAGAPLLAARSALAGGAGAVAIACPADLQGRYEAVAPGLLTVAIGKTDQLGGADAHEVLAAAARFDVLAVGPGLGRGREEFVATLLEQWTGPVVLDADAINAVEEVSWLRREGGTVITPHAGEFARLTGREADHREAARLAEGTGAIVLLKGNPTFVMGGRGWLVNSGGPELASIGTGDVLTGFVAALWARGLDGEAASRSGAFWHGRAGAALGAWGTVTAEMLAEEIGGWAWEAPSGGTFEPELNVTPLFGSRDCPVVRSSSTVRGSET